MKLNSVLSANGRCRTSRTQRCWGSKCLTTSPKPFSSTSRKNLPPTLRSASPPHPKSIKIEPGPTKVVRTEVVRQSVQHLHQLLSLSIFEIENGHVPRAGVAHQPRTGDAPAVQTYPIESVYKVVMQKSISAQIRQLVFYVSDDRG